VRCKIAGVLILASSSPRRADLLAAAGYAFVVRPVEADERLLDGERPTDYVLRLARAKAASGAACAPDEVVLAADTTVVAAGEILGKPGDDADAARMLSLLSGRRHEVLTGIAVRSGRCERWAVETTIVEFRPLSSAEIAWYVASGEPRDKAGAYAIQGLASRFVARIEGSYTNVVGLPVSVACRLLAEVADLG
jgi:septum formation protein